MADVSRAALALTLLLLGVAVAAEEVPAARRDALLHTLRHDCGSCHGLRLTGGLGPPLTAEALADRHPDTLAAVITHGRPGTPMPPWAGMLSDVEVRWLVGVLKRGEAEPR